jgi:hypothetical protein
MKVFLDLHENDEKQSRNEGLPLLYDSSSIEIYFYTF